MGRHLACLSIPDAIQMAKLQYISEVLEVLGAVCARISAAIFVARLFAVTSQMKILIYGYTIVMAAALIATACTVLTQCKPAAAIWDPLVPGKCWPESARQGMNYFNGGLCFLPVVSRGQS